MPATHHFRRFGPATRRSRVGAVLAAVAVTAVVMAAFPLSFPAGAQTADPPALGTPEGFGAKTTGGAGGATYWVTNGNDDGPGSLREGAESAEPLTIRFRFAGTIALRDRLKVTANKTLDGRGSDVTISGRGFMLTEPNVIVENFMFADIGNPERKEGTEDAILIDGASNVWIDHCTFARAADKAIGIPNGTDITVSWSRFAEQQQVLQIGTFTTRAVGSDARVTIHHNFFDSVGYRQPRVSYGKVHAYDNYLRRWTVHGMSAVRDSQLLSQSNIFEAGAKDNAIIFSGGDPEKDATPGSVRSEGDLLLNGAQVRENDPARVFDPSTYYTASVEPATEELRQRLISQTGRQTSSGVPEPSLTPEPTPEPLPAPSPVPGEPATPPQTSDTDVPWLLVGGVAIAVAAAAVAVVAWRRRRSGDAGPGSRPGGAPSASDRTPEPSSKH